MESRVDSIVAYKLQGWFDCVVEEGSIVDLATNGGSLGAFESPWLKMGSSMVVYDVYFSVDRTHFLNRRLL